MTEPRPRIFVSSVMKDYDDYRYAASQGIQRVGGDPIRAEDFPAASHSPRNGCLDGVRSADALVLLLGGRYGFVGPSGLATTEEEYEEARRTHKRILVFLQGDVMREPRQQIFVDRVQDYIDGHWRKVFHDPEELTDLVREAVAAAELDQTPGRHTQAKGRINTAFDRRPPENQTIVWLQTVWMTLRDEEVFDPLEFVDEPFKRQLMRLAHECKPPLFSYEQPKRSMIETSSFRVEQGRLDNWRGDRDLAVVEIFADGTLAIAQNVTGTGVDAGTLNPTGWHEMYFLEPEAVRSRLKQAWSFAAAWWKKLDPYRRHDPLLYLVALHDVGTRTFEPVPHHAQGGITIPSECPENPLFMSDRPRQVSRVELNAPETEIERIVKILELRFRQWRNRW